MICYEMFSSILGWSWQLYVALEFCSVLHITYYTVVPQQLYCIVLWVLLGCSTHQDSIPHSDTLIASSLQANKYYWWFEGRKLSFWIRITITNTNPIFNLILQSCVWCQNQWLLTEFGTIVTNSLSYGHIKASSTKTQFISNSKTLSHDTFCLQKEISLTTPLSKFPFSSLSETVSASLLDLSK